MKGDDGTRDGTRDGKWITRVEARTLLLAKSKCIHFSKNRFSARLVEDACQRKQNDTKLPLGHRLHRAISTGAFNDKDWNDDDYFFITYFTKTADISIEIINGKVVKVIGISHQQGHRLWKH